MERMVVLGAGGHGKCVAEAVRAGGRFAVAAFVDSDPALAGTDRVGIPVVGGDASLGGLIAGGVTLAAVGIGGVGDTSVRRGAHERLRALGFSMPPVVHPSSVVAPSASLGAGTQVLVGATVNPDAQIGEGTVVNDGVIVGHDCRVGAYVHLAPGAVLSGDVTVGDGSHVGTGATVLQGVTIGAGSIVGAGAVVITDVADGVTVVGVPARTP